MGAWGQARGSLLPLALGQGGPMAVAHRLALLPRGSARAHAAAPAPWAAENLATVVGQFAGLSPWGGHHQAGVNST